MLKIRKEQNDELAKVALKRFEDNMVNHVREQFPGHYKTYGDQTIRQVIRYGIKRAKSHGFTKESQVCLYISLMLMLGGNFDNDVQLPWASAILQNESILDPTERLDRLYDQAMDYMDRVFGLENEHRLRALVANRDYALMKLSDSDPRNIERISAAEMKKIWPNKYQSMDNTEIRKLIREGIDSAGKYGLTSGQGLILYIVLMFVLGAGFDTDPQHSWAKEILNPQTPSSELERVSLLHQRAIDLLNKCLG